MLKQYLNFDVRKFGSIFTENKLNGFDIMIMQSHEDANVLIEELKKAIDNYCGMLQQHMSIDYDDSNLLEPDKRRVKREIEKYISQKFNELRR